MLPTHSAMTHLVTNPLKLPEPWDLFSDTMPKVWIIIIPQYYLLCTNYNSCWQWTSTMNDTNMMHKYSWIMKTSSSSSLFFLLLALSNFVPRGNDPSNVAQTCLVYDHSYLTPLLLRSFLRDSSTITNLFCSSTSWLYIIVVSSIGFQFPLISGM